MIGQTGDIIVTRQDKKFGRDKEERIPANRRRTSKTPFPRRKQSSFDARASFVGDLLPMVSVIAVLVNQHCWSRQQPSVAEASDVPD